ncbi:MAG: hypothetical protein ACD_22C00072G0019 [uncultured bacterium]|nr:MAG: hypothetical protein ACD_22C00072G0019 [uncultured bacterium]
MLSSQDLSQIKLIVTDIVTSSENRIKTELRSELASKTDLVKALKPIKRDLIKVKSDLRALTNYVVRYIDVDVSTLRKTLSVLVPRFDEVYERIKIEPIASVEA